jgi:hypothetical protein
MDAGQPLAILEALLDLSRWVAGEPRWAGTAGKKTVEQESSGMAVVSNWRAEALLANTSLPGTAFQKRLTGFQTIFRAAQGGG